MKLITTILLISVSLMISSNASAVMLSFGCITNNSAINCASGESQLGLEVTDAMNDQVLFKFTNAGPVTSFISDIYFDNDSGTGIGVTLANIASLDESTGVDFGFPAGGMENFPGGNTVGFDTTPSLSAQNEPGSENGIQNTGNEMLGILLNLQMGRDFSDVLAELANGNLRVGIHVQGFPDSGNNGRTSESFVNAPVPIPAAVWLMGAGLIGLIGFGRKRQQV